MPVVFLPFGNKNTVSVRYFVSPLLLDFLNVFFFTVGQICSYLTIYLNIFTINVSVGAF